MIREWSLKKIDEDFGDEREEKQYKIRQLKSRLAGKPNWWHSTTGSPVTCEITQKVTDRNDGYSDEPTKHVKFETGKKEIVSKEFKENCQKAQNLKQTQMNDDQMYIQ